MVVDGAFLAAPADILYATGRYNSANLLVGSNRDEGTLTLLNNPRFYEYIASPSPPPIGREVLDEQLAFDFTVTLGKTWASSVRSLAQWRNRQPQSRPFKITADTERFS